ncbi:DNA polymerase delta, subunit 4-domain-containing protein [Mycena rosella]|uniref:DNA polymerase delta, subunit 4-domain-containing protein n=1 Tax=Mycena rosella TaxID=1033263 RepID=A0AAD7DRE3_MYCRO|nr:DNA polymerase delta, subunit 4-domain-containing protein [Mycena rosella]
MPKSSSKSKTVSSPSLKQATLAFSASKRIASNNSSKKVGKRPSLLSQARAVQVHSDSDDEIEVDDIDLSDDEVEIVEPDEPAEKESPRPKVAVSKPSIVKVTRPRDKASQSHELLELDENDPRWRPHLNAVRATRGYLQLIHAEDQDKFHDILRVFDLSYEYGPCVGVSRLERWERASALGLNPPTEVRDILTTRQGSKESYAQSVFYEEV